MVAVDLEILLNLIRASRHLRIKWNFRFHHIKYHYGYIGSY